MSIYAKKAKLADAVTSFNVLELDGVVMTVGTPSITVKEVTSDGNVTYAVGATIPTDGDAGYAVGCIFKNSAGGAGTTIYINEGSNTSASFRALDTAGGFSVPIAATDASSTTGTSLGITASTVTSGSIFKATTTGTALTTGSLFNAAMGAAVTGSAFTGLTTGIYTGAGLLQLTANSATTGTLAQITGTGLTSGPALSLTGPSSALFVAGLNGATNPAFKVDASTASSATGILVKSAAAAAGVAISAVSSGTNEDLFIDPKGTGFTKIGYANANSGVVIMSGAATALVVGPNNVSNPTFKVDTSTASAATGLLVKSAAAGGTLAVTTISSGTNESLSIDAKGTGYIALGSVSTGNVIIPKLQAAYNVAPPAGGSAAAQLMFSSTANLGLYFGSGAPTVTAAQGSIYVRTDGSSTSTRLYINTTGSTTWTNVTTAA